MRTWRVVLWPAGERRGFLPPGLGHVTRADRVSRSLGSSAHANSQRLINFSCAVEIGAQPKYPAPEKKNFSGLPLPFAPVIPPRAKSHPSSEGGLPTGNDNRVRNAFVGGNSERAMPDTGSPPGPPEPAGTQPWPGFDKFSAVQVGRPSPRGDPDVLATVHRRRTAPYTPSRKNRRAREAPERRARPPRAAPSTRRLPVKKAPPSYTFLCTFLSRAVNSG